MRYLSLLLLLAMACGGFAASVEQRPLVINQTTGKTEQQQAGNTLAIPTAASVGAAADLPPVGMVRVGGNSSDLTAASRYFNNQNLLSFNVNLGGSTSGTVPSWLNNAVLEVFKNSGMDSASLIYSAYKGDHQFTTSNLRTTRLTIGDASVDATVKLTTSDATASTSIITGSVVGAGGAGFGGAVWAGGSAHVGASVNNGGLVVAASNGTSPNVTWANAAGNGHWQMYETTTGGGALGDLSLYNFGTSSVGLSVGKTNNALNASVLASGSTTTNTLADRFSEVVDARDFGATGNGVTDDTTALQAALNTGRNVYVTHGNYLISSTLSFTANNQCLIGDGFSATNVVTTNPLTNVNMTQIFTNSAITMLAMGDYKGTQLKNVFINGNTFATNGITMSPTGMPSLGFNIVLENVYVSDVITTALDTGYAADSTFIRVCVNGFHNTAAAVTTTGIRVGGTNVSFVGCWVHGTKNAVLAAGSIARFTDSTFTSFPYNSAQPHLKISSTSVANYSFTNCYFETMPMIDPNSKGIGALTYTGCFMETQDPTNLFDLSTATSGTLSVVQCRLHETTIATRVNAPSPLSVSLIGNAQTAITTTGTAAFLKAQPVGVQSAAFNVSGTSGSGYQLGAAFGYGYVALNADATLSGTLGMFGGATGDNDLYLNCPLNQTVYLRANNATLASFAAAGSVITNPLSVTGNVTLNTAGNGLKIKEGTNATMGTATLSGGTVVVNTTKVTATSRIFLTGQSLGTVAVPSNYGVSARSAGTSFTILASAPTDTSVVAWEIIEPAP